MHSTLLVFYLFRCFLNCFYSSLLTDGIEPLFQNTQAGFRVTDVPRWARSGTDVSLCGLLELAKKENPHWIIKKHIFKK